MERVAQQKSSSYVDRRQPEFPGQPARPERRQFSDSRTSVNPQVNELAEAVDQYKLRHRRRFITFDELFDVIVELGYHK